MTTAAKPRSATSAKRLTLIATILGSSIVLLDGSVVSVALPSIQRSLGGGLAGQQGVSNAYLLTLGSLILLGGSLAGIFGERGPFGLGVPRLRGAAPLCATPRRRRLRRGVAVVRNRADDRAPDRVQGAPGDRGRAAHTQLAGLDRLHLSGAGARAGDRHVDRVGNDRVGARPARRWRAPRRRVVAMGLPDQHAAGARVPLAGHQGRSRGEAPGDETEGRRDRSGAVRPRAGRDGLRADRTTAPRLVELRGDGVADRRRGAVRRLPRLRSAREPSDAAAGPVQAPQLRRGQCRDVCALRRPVRPVLLPRVVPPAGRRLYAAPERACAPS